MNISAADYKATTDDILIAMKRLGDDEAARNDLLAIIYSLKGKII